MNKSGNKTADDVVISDSAALSGSGALAAIPTLSGSTAVYCKGLGKSFTSKAETLEVLRGLDLELPEGSSCSIVGASGSGKSTLLSILGGIERLDKGELRVGGYELHRLPEKELPVFRTRVIGFVFQFHYLLKDFTALENVALPAYMAGLGRKKAWEKAEHLLEKVGLAERLGHFPSELSGGERQRAAIARALVNDPRVILADEPTGNLDAQNAATVSELLFELPAITGASLVLATHDRELAKKATIRFALIQGLLQAL
ncbi:MAG: ABC transporter ATP-binding protein [Spirochaetia bacterium]|jgi:lipoprotein-releasing system ATP-binding protein|nr:ABC transporter ATP-binding protein [Spirochaetales bacterium]MDX9784431.1 ABC transporter ATP-binding protein [Spirochaetia bacterium]